jgi:hypothetical protein
LEEDSMDDAPAFGPRRSSLVQWVVILGVLVTVAALAIPGLFVSGRASNDRREWNRIKALTSAETDFRANDRDWNHVNDYWTGDVKGLYTLTSSAVPGVGGLPDDPPIKLIELSVAAADADGNLVPAGGENSELSLYGIPAPRAGYWYAALTVDLEAGTPYRQETGGTPSMGSCHNLSKYGFVAFPDSPSAGPYVYIVNENNIVYRASTTGLVKTERATPPGLNGFDPAYRNWPKAADLKLYWSALD